MTKDRLRSMRFSEIVCLAEQGRVYVPQGIDKESLISLVFDAFEDERMERESNNNLTIQVEAKKYVVSQDEELYLDFAADVELKNRYHETSLVLILRDPSWVYCYWDISDRMLTELEQNPVYAGLILRTTELATSDWEQDSSIDWFDIPIQFADLSRYINLPHENSFYGVELFAKFAEHEVLISRSNIIESSRAYVATAHGNENPNRDQLIRLAGFSTDVGAYPGVSYLDSDSPQRILSVISPKWSRRSDEPQK